LARRCLKKLADDNEQEYPRAAQVLNNDFYVDDLLSGTSTIEDALNVQKELSALFQTAGLTLRKLASNHITFLDTIPLELQETQSKLSLDNEDSLTILGLLWNPKDPSEEQSHTDAFNRLPSEYKTKGVSYYSIYF
jgi:hypothetical protein